MMQARLPLPESSTLTPEQRRIHDSILATRGNLSGPFLAWLHVPGLASPAEQLGAFCRYGTSFALVESELLILCVARHYHCEGERLIHEPIAIQAGLPPEAVAALRADRAPELTDARQALLVRLADALLIDKRWTDDLYAEGLAVFGTQGMVELVGVLGYYALTAYTLNAFDMRP
ncbi:MAG: carboxymuconolactone decarboxylase family protein [Pigmentiphaga sp.]